MIPARSAPQPHTDLAPPAPLAAVATWMLRRYLTIFAWFAGLATLVVIVLVPPMLQRYEPDIEFSVWEMFAASSPSWFIFALGAVAAQYLPVLVAQGVTRRRFLWATATALAATALLVAAAVVLGFVLEGIQFERLGLNTALRQAHAYTTGDQYGLVAAEALVRSLLFAFTGLLVGLAFYRFGAGVGTALLLVTAALPLGVGGLLLSVPLGPTPLVWTGFGPATTLGVLLLLGFDVALLLICTWFGSTVAVRTKGD